MLSYGLKLAVFFMNISTNNEGALQDASGRSRTFQDALGRSGTLRDALGRFRMDVSRRSRMLQDAHGHVTDMLLANVPQMFRKCSANVP